MSITYSGFKRENIEEVIERLVGQVLDAFPTLSLTPDNIVYQIIKIMASRS